MNLGRFFKNKRTFLYGIGLLLISMLAYFYSVHIKALNAELKIKTDLREGAIVQNQLSEDFKNLSLVIKKIKAENPEVELTSQEIALLELKKLILSGENEKAREIYAQISTAISTISAEIALKGTLTLKTIADNKPVAATINILQGEKNQEIKSNSEGIASLKLLAGKFTIKVKLDGYLEFSQEVEILAQKTSEITASLNKVPVSQPSQVQASATVPAEESDADSSYIKKSVVSDRGTYTVYLMTFNLSGVDMIVDTASDGDCETGCPVKSLQSYIQQNSGFAGINGTYFCPTAYASCTSETNHFYYKLYNSRLQKKINWTNGIGENLAFLMVNNAGVASFYNNWNLVKNLEMKAGISCRPTLVVGGQAIVTMEDLDSDKEKYSKISRGFIGINGQTVYAGVIYGATMLDSAAVVSALGVQYAINIDGGGSSALYYNGYKVGPGRDLPNAIIFRKK